MKLTARQKMPDDINAADQAGLIEPCDWLCAEIDAEIMRELLAEDDISVVFDELVLDNIRAIIRQKQ